MTETSVQRYVSCSCADGEVAGCKTIRITIANTHERRQLATKLEDNLFIGSKYNLTLVTMLLSILVW